MFAALLSHQMAPVLKFSFAHSNVLLLTALVAQILSKEIMGDWIEYRINLVKVYKNGNSSPQTNSLWVPTKDADCKCPKLKIKSKYIIIGTCNKKKSRQDSQSSFKISADRREPNYAG